MVWVRDPKLSAKPHPGAGNPKWVAPIMVRLGHPGSCDPIWVYAHYGHDLAWIMRAIKMDGLVFDFCVFPVQWFTALGMG